ncbi:MAG: asparagine synthetase B [Flavobacteriaceae bacterium]|nr:asparagine synthetase B [Flavobacteriaceae bacterium]|tara:strand:- start:12251 stop:12799 length:549 start_codon:yes stop_codon:yes gene_type:complete
MKKITLSLSLVFALCLFFTSEATAQKFSKMDVSPMDAASYPSDYRNAEKLIKIVYSRPQLKERSLTKLTPYGEVWRTGANEAAELTLYTDMTLGGKAVPAGTYTFYTIPGEKEWTAIINSDLNVWGSYFYDESKDVARITVPATMAEDSLEEFSIAFEEATGGVDMHLGWGKTRVAVPFKKK